jgi:hypothetical protein
MFNTLKIAQAEKQIYPERFGKVIKARPEKMPNDHTSPEVGTTALTAPVSGAGR